jgi:hypothetical protein
MVSDYDLIGSAAEGIGNGIDKTAHAFDCLFPGVRRFWLRRADTADYQSGLREISAALDSTQLSRETKDTVIASYALKSHGLENLASVLQKAGPLIQPGTTDNVQHIDLDWVDSFQDKASRSNHEDIQQLWAALLAGEISAPGAFSKRTLAALDTLNTLEARRFTRLCSWCADIPSADDPGRLVPVPMLAQENEDGEPRGGIPLQELRILEDAGLTTQTFSYKFIFKPGRNPIYVGGQERFVDNSSDEQRGFLPGYGLTTTGEELSRLCIRGTAEADIAGIISARLESLAWKTATPKIRRKQQ